MTKPKLVVLVVAVILIGVIAKISAGPASTRRDSQSGSSQNGIHVAKPESMKEFPAGLIPMP
jgi:hypothetical protein